jgi:uncharacterized YccA/Bax inhibitor family protein
VTRSEPVSPLLWLGLFGGLVVALVTCFKPEILRLLSKLQNRK